MKSQRCPGQPATYLKLIFHITSPYRTEAAEVCYNLLMNEKYSASSEGIKDSDLDEVHQLKLAGLGLLYELTDVSREVQMQIKDIFDKPHIQKHFLIVQLVDYLDGKNPNILKADALIKQGHELGKSVTINEFELSSEEIQLLEWFRQVRE
jgi:hypothetical protein